MFAKILDGTPIVIIERGVLHRDLSDRVRIHDQDIMDSARSQGITRMNQIRHASVERSGQIAIINEQA